VIEPDHSQQTHMFGWFSKRKGGAPTELDLELSALEKQARAAQDQTQGHLFNRCGDLCVVAKRKTAAVRYYGMAVDAYLTAGYVGPAAAICRKILRVAPGAVRTHCTLACLAAHEGHLDEARQCIDRFVEASELTGTEKLAVARLRLVGAAVTDEWLLQHIAECLGQLGDSLGRDRIEAMIRDGAEVDPLAPGVWERLLKAAAADPDDLWKFG
jgi:hypothetical protein